VAQLSRAHASIPRNPLIAEPMFFAHYAEKAGSGILDMIARCKQFGFPPIAGNGITGAGEPFFVTAKLFQCFRGKELRAVAGGMAERFQQSRRDQHGDFMRIKAKKPRRLGSVEAGGNHLPTEKFALLCDDIHKAAMVDGQVCGRCRRPSPDGGRI